MLQMDNGNKMHRIQINKKPTKLKQVQIVGFSWKIQMKDILNIIK